MLETEKPTRERDVIEMAREQVKITPRPEWVRPCSYAADFKPSTPSSAIFLLSDRQIHAELQQTYVRNVMRLDTQQAVQHHSQWRLEFIPLTQSLELHSVKIKREGEEIEHASLDRVRFLQREAGLEGFVLQGGVTLLLLIEDVRIGDILEYSYTSHHRSQMLAEHCMALFTLPENLPLGKHHLLVRFSESRPLKWKSSSADLAPVEQRENQEISWQWLNENYLAPEREKNTPAWHVTQQWIQISDCTDWRTVATALHDCWKEDLSAPSLVAKAEEIKSQETDLLRQAGHAIRTIQDDFRYLSVNIELGGHVPAAAENIIRRRYGDCKDLTFFLVQLLRLLGIKARPILVNTNLLQSIKEMLPAPQLFNHAIVEYQIGEETRWVDPTLKGQGGDALHKLVPNFGLGLPIDPSASELIPPPSASLPQGAFELKESFLVDTTGKESLLAVLVKATGFYAEKFRRQTQNEGVEAISKERLQYYANRFSQAKRVDPLQFRDDREANEFVLAEVFEINGFLKHDRPTSSSWMQLHNSALIGVLPPDMRNSRRSPLELPYPCKITHTLEVESTALPVLTLPAFRLKNGLFEFSCASRGVRKFTTVTFNFTTLTNSVPPDRMTKFLRDLEHLVPYVTTNLRLPMGYPRMRKPGNFGALPGSESKSPPAPSTPPSQLETKLAINHSPASQQSEKTIQEDQKTVALENPPSPSRRRRSRRHSNSGNSQGFTKTEAIAIATGLLVIVGTLVGLLLLANH